MYDANGQRVASTDKAGRMSATVYDSLGRTVMSGPASAAGSADGKTPPTWLMDTATPAHALVSTTVYDDAGEVTSSQDALGHGGSTTYDNLGRTAISTDALNNVTKNVYDDDGRQLSVTDANLHTTSYDYDDAGRLTVTHYPDKSTSSTGYDELGRRLSQTDQAGHTTYYAYDTLGRLQSVTDPMTHVTQFGYDALGEKTSQTDANGHITKFSYDIRGRLLSKTLPGGQYDGRTYDGLSRLSTMTDFNGKMTTFAYDPLSGRLMSKTASVGGTATGEGVSFTYNLLDGSRKTATRTMPGGTSLTTTYAYYGYDGSGNPTPDFRQGQLKSVTTTASGGASRIISYDYDILGNKTLMTTPGGSKIGYGYDWLNRLSTVTHPDSAVTTFGYDKVGNRQSVSRATSATAPAFSTTSYAYDSLNRLTDIINKNGSSGLVSSYHYGLRLDGKRYSVTESGPATNGGTTNYTYDDQGKLIEEASPYADIKYGYDNVGNRLTRTVTGAATGNGTTLVNGTTVNTYDQNDRVVTVNGSATHSYDLDGNETTVNGQTASYDFENHLVSLANTANNTVLTSYTYDADSNRYSAGNSTTTTSYIVDASLPYASVVEEYSNGTLAARYDYGDDLLRMDRGGVYYYLFDGLGSTRQLVNTAGAVTDTWGYSAFGEMASHTGTTVNPFLFNAQQFDQASGDYYLRARYYDQSNGRFISQDPFGGDQEDTITLHRYLYTGDEPVNRQDKSGEDFGVSDTLIASINSVTAEGEGDVAPVAAESSIVASTGTATSYFTGSSAVGVGTLGARVFAGGLAGLIAYGAVGASFAGFSGAADRVYNGDGTDGSSGDNNRNRMRVQFQQGLNGATPHTAAVSLSAASAYGVSVQGVRDAMLYLFYAARSRRFASWFSFPDQQKELQYRIFTQGLLLNDFYADGLGVSSTGTINDRKKNNPNLSNEWPGPGGSTYRIDIENQKGTNLKHFDPEPGEVISDVEVDQK